MSRARRPERPSRPRRLPRPHRALRPLYAPVRLTLLLLFVASPVAAQSVAGVVLDEGDAALEGVVLRLLNVRGAPQDSAVSDEEGGFLLSAPESGTYFLAASRLGYASVRSDTLELVEGEQVAVEVRLAVEAVMLEPVVVTGRSQSGSPDIDAFYDRMERGRRSGFGTFISRNDVERSHPAEASDLLRTMASIRVVPGRRGFGSLLRMSGGCYPAIYIDGMMINRSLGDSVDEYVAAHSIEGIEVYRQSQMGRFHDPRGCGLVLVWTRRGHRTEGPFPWGKAAIGAGLIGLLFLLN